jgi:DNA-binding beta-propeller fold protein YncE
MDDDVVERASRGGVVESCDGYDHRSSGRGWLRSGGTRAPARAIVTRTLHVGALAAIISTGAGVAAAGAPLPALSCTVPLRGVKGGFDQMAADVAGHRLFLAAEDNGTVEVIDTDACKRLRSVPGIGHPKWVVYRPESNRLYVSSGDGPVHVLDSRSFARITSFPFREASNNLRYDATTGELFVGVGRTFGGIGVIDTRRDRIAGEIALASAPKQFEVTADRILVNVPGANHVAVIDRKRKAVVARWRDGVPPENVPMAFDRTRGRLFVGGQDGSLAVLDATSGRAVAAVPIAKDADGVHYDEKRQRLYVSCGAGWLEVIRQRDADHYEAEGRVATAAGAATSLFAAARGQILVAVPQAGTQPAELRIYEVGR